MKLRMTLKQAIGGYWNDGKKQVFDWELGGVFEDAKGKYVKIHGFGANYWFHVAQGKTDKQTLSYAKNHLRRVFRDIEKFEYVGSDGVK